MSSHDIAPIVFLFGAGASFGTDGHVFPQRPPLGRDLYDELASFAPATWGPGSYLGGHGHTFRPDFEAAMNAVSLRAPTLDVLEWLRDVARYFSRFTLDGTGEDPYSNLVRGLRERDALSRTVFASLNYECLLELAANALGVQVTYERRVGDQMEVLKIHGSSNFVTNDLTSHRHLLTNPNSQLGCDSWHFPLVAR